MVMSSQLQGQAVGAKPWEFFDLSARFICRGRWSPRRCSRQFLNFTASNSQRLRIGKKACETIHLQR